MISFDADVTYVEKKMTKIEFNRQGDVISIKSFQKKIYDDKMRENIIEDLLDKTIELKNRKRPIDAAAARRIADTLQY